MTVNITFFVSDPDDHELQEMFGEFHNFQEASEIMGPGLRHPSAIVRSGGFTFALTVEMDYKNSTVEYGIYYKDPVSEVKKPLSDLLLFIKEMPSPAKDVGYKAVFPQEDDLLLSLVKELY